MTVRTLLCIGGRGRFDRFIPHYLRQNPDINCSFAGRADFRAFLETQNPSSILEAFESESGLQKTGLRIFANQHFLTSPDGIVEAGCFYPIANWRMRQIANSITPVDAWILFEISDFLDLFDKVSNETFRQEVLSVLAEQPSTFAWTDVIDELLTCIPAERLIVINGSSMRTVAPQLLGFLLGEDHAAALGDTPANTERRIVDLQSEAIRLRRARARACRSMDIDAETADLLIEIFEEQLELLSMMPIRTFL